MKKYALIALVNMSGGKGVKIGERIPDLNAEQVEKLIKQGVGKFATDKEYKSFLDEFESEKRKKEEEEAKAKAILEREKNIGDLTALYTEVVKKEAALVGKVLTAKEVLAGVETLLKRVEG